MDRPGRSVWPYITAVAILVVAVLAAILLTSGDGDEKASADAQTVRFQKPTDKGPDPFTRPADVRGGDRVDVGSGPFGGTGSDLVCDRELLIRSLRARPDRMREWARVLDLEPDIRKVARYIRTLRPVTLTRDTRVTNHSFQGDSAVAFQAILQAGTAVLVDKDGVPVARCRCGNPLLEPIYVKTAKCFGCPPNYRPPPPCEYFDYRDSDFARYDDEEFINAFDPREYRGKCYLPYPDPPKVKRRRRRATPPTRPAEPSTNPRASFSPSAGTEEDSYTLSASGFRPGRTLTVTLTRPDGVVERSSITTDASGSGSKFFPRVSNPVLGTYTAVVADSGSGDRATASTTVRPAARRTPPPEPETPPPSTGTDELQCDPPRSQLEFELCRDQGR